VPVTSHCRSFDQRRLVCAPFTAIASAFRCPTSTTVACRASRLCRPGSVAASHSALSSTLYRGCVEHFLNSVEEVRSAVGRLSQCTCRVVSSAPRNADLLLVNGADTRVLVPSSAGGGLSHNGQGHCLYSLASYVFQSGRRRAPPPVRRRGSTACLDTQRSNRPCATTISTRSVFPDSMSLPHLNPVEPPWYVTRMPGGVGGRRREAPPDPDQSLLSEFPLMTATPQPTEHLTRR
jgi:hypothetical protein